MHPIFDDRRYLIPFRATLLPQIFTDTLIIGSGVAGLRAALAAREHGDVMVASKGEIQNSNTYWAQGGVAAVIDKADSVAEHVADTLSAGADLCDEPAVRTVVKHGPARIDELIAWGMRFDASLDDPETLALGREGGHGRSRILHSDGDATGRELVMTLDRQVRLQENIRLFSHCFVLDLITIDGSTPRCIGAITHHPKYGLQVIWAQATILASGGAGQVFRESTNPAVATGDGLAMAYRAGAVLADMAFMQFHPTTLYVAGASRSLITEAVRGEGAYLIDRAGYRFMGDYHDMKELAPRDVVSRAILSQMHKTSHAHVYLDVRHLDQQRFSLRFPGLYKLLKKFEIDPATQPIPIHPSAHYMIGGVRTDAQGRTSITGLYAAGEVSNTGLHGANRLASNSLLEGLVYGQITGSVCKEMSTEEARHGGGPSRIISDIRPSDRSEMDLGDVRSTLRSVMWRHVGIERDGHRLAEVSEMFDFWARYCLDKIFDDRAGWEVQNLLVVGKLITTAALWRCETRGTHARVDYPEPRSEFHVHDLWQRHHNGPMTSPVLEKVKST
jgi:L-aspartate oxidase